MGLGGADFCACLEASQETDKPGVTTIDSSWRKPEPRGLELYLGEDYCGGVPIRECSSGPPGNVGQGKRACRTHKFASRTTGEALQAVAMMERCLLKS